MKKKDACIEVDQYIGNFPDPIRRRLSEIRGIILREAPGVVESISYGMPAYKLNGRPLVYFAGYTGHVGFYATPAGHEAFAKDLSAYKQGKGSVQFPHQQPLPDDLIINMVKFRYQQESGRTGKKKHP